jgi:hypothetical protein
MMASKLAILLAAPSADEDDNPDTDAVAWCDHKLQEVREVLDLCEAALAAAEPYVARDLAVAIRERRQRARQLAERLRVG